jgi:acyl-CoA thioesterase I
MKLPNLLFLTAAFVPWCLPALLIAQTPGHMPETSRSQLTVAAPSWQAGAYWSRFDQGLLVDFGDLARYHHLDLKLGPPAAGQDRVVFMGDSITDGWNLAKYFPGKPYINRGISGQTSTQMLVRFRQDVIDLYPKVVVILAGTNDLAGNTGPMTLKETQGNLMSMAQLATDNGIRVVLCSVLPSIRFWWHPGLKDPAARIAALNQWIRAYAEKAGYVYVDYYSAMKDAAGGLPRKLSGDGAHPLPAGYAVMAPLAEAGIEKALKNRDQSGVRKLPGGE